MLPDFDDERVYTNDIKKVFSINNFAALEENENWKNIISKKLSDKEFIETTFDTVFLKNN